MSPPHDLQISVLPQITFCSCVIESTLFCNSADGFSELSKSLLIVGNSDKQTQSSNDKTIRTWLSQNVVICYCLTDQIFA